ncbi:hypothetical protein [Ferruginibacter sp. SUN106]|uniref:hypothetical protein n=1 Tax=Ferruginibacter sp. SUN106 TaxID=2978348 RepID=UPI003D36DE28
MKLTALALIISFISFSSFKSNNTEPTLHESKVYVGKNIFQVTTKEKMDNWLKESTKDPAKAKIINFILKKHGELASSVCLGGWNSEETYCLDKNEKKSLCTVNQLPKFILPVLSQWWCLYDCETGEILTAWWSTAY